MANAERKKSSELIETRSITGIDNWQKHYFCHQQPELCQQLCQGSMALAPPLAPSSVASRRVSGKVPAGLDQAATRWRESDHQRSPTCGATLCDRPAGGREGSSAAVRDPKGGSKVPLSRVSWKFSTKCSPAISE